MFGWKLPLRCAVVVLALVASLMGPVRPAAAQSPWIDTSNRAAVEAAFATEFSRAVPDMGWTGTRAGCDAGRTSLGYRDTTLLRLNYFRAMAGVPATVTENPDFSVFAQQTALSMSETGRLTHAPDESFRCLNAHVQRGAQESNLYLGRTGPVAVNGYIEDPGRNNAWVGHRSWLLRATLTQVGLGDVPAGSSGSPATAKHSGNAIFVAAATPMGPEPAVREAEGFVAWPPRGYVPAPIVYPRWSFHLREADFRQANVTMTSSAGTVNAPVVHRGSPDALASIVWEPSGLSSTPRHDEPFTITVSGVRVGGQSRTYRYDVIVMGEQGPRPQVNHDAYITRAYQDFLGRQPNATEMGHWNAQLNRNGNRNEFVTHLARSNEWTLHVVDGMYRDTLGRAGDAEGRAYWSGLLRQGVPVASVAAEFYGSREYVARQGGGYQQWLHVLYGVLLERAPDPSGLQFWSAQVPAQGSHTVALEFYQSTESRRARVSALYRQLLGRSPDPEGLIYWGEVLRSGDDLALATFLASSTEYVSRSGQR